MDLIFIFFTGACFGSFMNVVIHRLPFIIGIVGSKKQPLSYLAYPPSRCPKCKKNITWTENIPILSYLFLKGECKSCKTNISFMYLINEVSTALLFTFFYLFFGFSTEFFLLCVMVLCSVVLFWIDYQYFILPNLFNYTLMISGILFNYVGGFVSMYDALIGAAVAYVILRILFEIHFRITKKEGMGFGDFKLIAAYSGWLGWQSLPYLMMISSIIGLLYFFTRKKLKQIKLTDPIPFGPSLIIAGLTLIINNLAF